MRKLTTSVGDKLLVLNKLTDIEIKYIPETKSSKTFKYH